MYEQIEVLMKLIDEKVNMIVMGNFNASVKEQHNTKKIVWENLVLDVKMKGTK